MGPRAGSCSEDQALPTSSAAAAAASTTTESIADCAWKRLPASRIFWGEDLRAQGWNFTFVQVIVLRVACVIQSLVWLLRVIRMDLLKRIWLPFHSIKHGSPGHACRHESLVAERCCV